MCLLQSPLSHTCGDMLHFRGWGYSKISGRRLLKNLCRQATEVVTPAADDRLAAWRLMCFFGAISLLVIAR